jgi:AraC-like DNA-binding protein
MRATMASDEVDGVEACGPAGEPSPAYVRLSTRELAQDEGQGALREYYGRIGMGIDMAPLSDDELAFDASTLILPGVRVSMATTTPAAWDRRRDLTADGNTEFVIAWGAHGFACDRPGRTTLELAGSTAFASSFDRPWTVSCRGPWATSIQISRDLLAERVPELDDVPLDRVDRRRPEAALLFDYQWLVARNPLTAAMTARVATHIVDLAALCLGPASQAGRERPNGGVRAARLLALKRHIDQNLHRSSLSARTAARALGISERYVRDLFAEQETSFADYVADCRLDEIRHRLQNAQDCGRSLAEIAADAGFAQPSTFYRRFKARFGIAPSDLRRG